MMFIQGFGALLGAFLGVRLTFLMFRIFLIERKEFEDKGLLKYIVSIPWARPEIRGVYADFIVTTVLFMAYIAVMFLLNE